MIDLHKKTNVKEPLDERKCTGSTALDGECHPIRKCKLRDE
jgi:hypothetical protein